MNAGEWKTVLFWKKRDHDAGRRSRRLAGVITVVVKRRQQRKLAEQQFEIQEKAQLEVTRNAIRCAPPRSRCSGVDYECKVFAC